MRELKFRAWNIKHFKMVELDGIKGDMGFATTGGYNDWYRLNEIMQYIGLNDNNGKNIYEGDIVNCTYGKWHNEPKGLTRVCTVIYDDDTCSFRMKVKGSAMKVLFADSFKNDIEIIGNIYENPKL